MLEMNFYDLQDLAEKHKNEKIGKALMTTLLALQSAVQQLNEAQPEEQLDDDEIVREFLVSAERKVWQRN